MLYEGLNNLSVKNDPVIAVNVRIEGEPVFKNCRYSPAIDVLSLECFLKRFDMLSSCQLPFITKITHFLLVGSGMKTSYSPSNTTYPLKYFNVH